MTNNPWHVINTVRGPVSSPIFTLTHVPLTSLSLPVISPTSWAIYKKRLGLHSKLNWHLTGMVGFLVYSEASADDLPEWREIKVAPASRRIVSRVSNRVYVGSSLCKIILPTTLVNLHKLTFHRPESGVAGPQCRLYDNGHEMGHVHEPVPQFYSTV